MDMPLVRECSALSCAYNADRRCHALAITIGDTGHPHCDTFCDIGAKGGDLAVLGRVGACKTADCAFNRALECTAPAIVVGYARDDMDCTTYRSR